MWRVPSACAWAGGVRAADEIIRKEARRLYPTRIPAFRLTEIALLLFIVVRPFVLYIRQRRLMRRVTKRWVVRDDAARRFADEDSGVWGANRPMRNALWTKMAQVWITLPRAIVA